MYIYTYVVCIYYVQRGVESREHDSVIYDHIISTLYTTLQNTSVSV